MSAQYFRFSARPPAAPRRSLLLEQLLARADNFAHVNDWRVDAFRVIAPQAATMPAVAAAALFADRGAMQAAWVCIAAPVHYLAEMSNVRLSPDGLLALRTCGGRGTGSGFQSRMERFGHALVGGPIRRSILHF